MNAMSMFPERGVYLSICPQEGAVWLICNRAAVLLTHHNAAQQHHLVNFTTSPEMTSSVIFWDFPHNAFPSRSNIYI